MVNLSNRFDFIEIAVSWEKNGMAVSHGNAFAALNCFALFVYALATNGGIVSSLATLIMGKKTTIDLLGTAPNALYTVIGVMA